MEFNSNVKHILDFIAENDFGICVRSLTKNNKGIYILFIPSITDKNSISNNIIRPILQHNEHNDLSIGMINSSVIYVEETFTQDNFEMILDYILKGKSIILLSDEKKYIVASTKKFEKRDVTLPQIQDGLRVPKDSFTENMDTNISLIRYRIKDVELKIDKYELGKRTKTEVSVIYLKDVTNDKYINEIRKKMKNIDVDGVLESSYVEKFLVQSDGNKLFPKAAIAERSDKACASILEGAICILVEGSNIAIILPTTIVNFLDSGDDHYENQYLSIITKTVRILCIIIALTLPSFYIAIVAYHPEILPARYIITLAYLRASVPINAFLEVFLMEIVSMILVEGSIRLPKQIGSAIGIVGTIVIGQAAVSAGLVSALMVIIVSLDTMASFILPDYTFMSSITVCKFLLIILTGFLGLYGLIIGFTLIVIDLVSTDSLGAPYTSPYAPLVLKDYSNFMLSNILNKKFRPKYLKTKDNKMKN